MAQVRQQSPTPVGASENERCPECDGTVKGQEERICGDCGLVVGEDAIDRSPVWRGGSQSGRVEKARTGPPTSVCTHDKNLQSQIGWANRDANGKTLSVQQRAQAERLRRTSRWGTTTSSREETLKKALAEVQRMTCALGLPEYAAETASVVVRECRQQDLFKGRSIEAAAAAAVTVGARQHGVPRSVSDIATVARVEQRPILRCLRYLSAELELAVEPVDPVQLVAQFASELEMGEDVQRLARALIEQGVEVREDGLSGRNPVSIAAGALYLSGRHVGSGEKRTQAEISSVVDVSANSIRDAYRALDSVCEISELPNFDREQRE